MSNPLGWQRPADPWFTIGKLEVGTAVIITAGVVVSWIANAILPGAVSWLYYSPANLAGQPWTLFTWPAVNSISFWAVVNLFFFWYFASDLELRIGRARLAWLVVGIWACLTAATTVIGLALGGAQALAGFSSIAFLVMLVWIADSPNRQFWFGIPAWIFAAILLGIQILGLVADRALGALLSLAVSLVLVALVARRLGLLNSFTWLPGPRKQGSVAKTAHPSNPGRRQPRTAKTARSDAERLDQLLDQINEKGLHSLSAAQRKELLRLRDRRRQG